MKKSEKPLAEVSTSELAFASVTEEAIRARAYELRAARTGGRSRVRRLADC